MTDHIRNFWEMFNCSKCKTAMLLITLIIFIGLAFSEGTGNKSDILRGLSIGIISYWGGRTSKAQENIIGGKI